MQKLITSLWFDSQAEDAARFYCSIFENSRVNRVTHYGPAGPGEPGTVLAVDFELNGVGFNAINGGPLFHFSEATSVIVNCDSQAEVDRFWEALGAGGEYSQCGWLKDRYGFSWQIVPTVMEELLSDPDEAKSQRVMAAMLQMGKIDIAALQRAAEG
jgi:predicted 3-demethylubiquinone-9 3-methyltransferase (glyoxalase superfamily)